ncbi:hypothetical protein ACFQYP_61765 [Nonomuraea antimicrobica]
MRERSRPVAASSTARRSARSAASSPGLSVTVTVRPSGDTRRSDERAPGLR